MKGLHIIEQVPAPAKLRRCELVEIAGVGLAFLEKGPALTRADPCSREFCATRKRDLCFLGQGTKAHIRDEQWDLEGQRSRSPRSKGDLSSDDGIVHQRLGSELGCQDLDVVPMGQVPSWDTHGPHFAMMTERLETISSKAMDTGDCRFFGR